MYGGMTRNELRALVGLIVLICVGVGAQQFVRSRKDGRFWAEIAPERAAVSERGAASKPDAGAISANLLDTASDGEGDADEAASASNETSARLEADAEGRLDLNAATASDLSALPQIGEKRAAAILRLRESRGGFARVEELLDVDGIGEKTLEKIRPFVWVGPRRSESLDQTTAAPPPLPAATPIPAPSPGPQSTPAAASRSSSPLSRSSVPKETRDARIDINSADAAELEELWGVGPAKARAIVEWRKRHGPFRTIEDLVRVPGIGAETLRRNRERLEAVSRPVAIEE